MNNKWKPFCDWCNSVRAGVKCDVCGRATRVLCVGCGDGNSYVDHECQTISIPPTETVKMEVSEFELSLLIGLVSGRLLEYQEIAARNAADLETMSGAMSLKDLYEKLHSAKIVPTRS